MAGVVLLALVLSAALALILTAALVPLIKRLSERYGWVQYPGGRRQHRRPTSNIGGLSMYAGFSLTVVLSLLLDVFPEFARTPFEKLRIGLLLLGSSLLFLVMLVDDIRELPPLPKLLAQIGSALIAVGPYLWDQQRYANPEGALTEARGIILTAFNFPGIGQISLWNVTPWLAIGVTIFWIVGMSNTINFSDGMDGLAGGISLIASLMLALHAINLGQYTIALLPLALAGACAGFLLFNFPPASIFMGDCGAHLLGYVLGVSAIIGGAKLASALLLLGVPILDVAWLIVSRLLGQRSPAHAGRDHLHHRLLDAGFTPRQILAFYYTLSLSFGLLGVSQGASGAVKLIALMLLGVIVAVVLVFLARRTRAGTAHSPHTPTE